MKKKLLTILLSTFMVMTSFTTNIFADVSGFNITITPITKDDLKSLPYQDGNLQDVPDVVNPINFYFYLFNENNTEIVRYINGEWKKTDGDEYVGTPDFSSVDYIIEEIIFAPAEGSDSFAEEMTIKANGDALSKISNSHTGEEGYLIQESELYVNEYELYVNVKFQIASYAAEIDGKKYKTLQDAIAAVKDGETITLLNNETIEFNSPIIINKTKSITLDLNGNTLKGVKKVNGKDFIWVENGCTLTIKDSGSEGKITSDAYDAATIYVEGAVILDSGIVESTGDGDSLGGCVFDVRPNDFGQGQGYVYTTDTTSLTINGGVVRGNGSNTIRLANSAVETTRKNQIVKAIMNGGVIENAGDGFFIQLWTGIKCIGNLSVEINGGEIKCKQPVRAFSTSWTTNKQEGQGSIDIAINGGKISMAENGKTYWKGVAVQNIASGGTVENVESFMNVAISGGYFTYNNTLADGVVEGNEVIDTPETDPNHGDYPFMIGKIEVAKNNRTGEIYPALQVAIDSSESGDTVSLLKDIDFGVLDDKTTGVKINSDKNIVLDLNGFTISGSKTNKDKNVYVILNDGKLTIVDNSTSKTGKVSLNQDTTVWNYSTDGVAIENHGDLIVNSGTIEAKRNSTGMVYAIDNIIGYGVEKIPSLVLNGGVINSDYAAIRMYAQRNIGTKNIKAVVNNTEINSGWAFFLQDLEASTNIIDIEINGGKYNSTNDMFYIGLCSNNVSKIQINKVDNEKIISNNNRSLIAYDYDGANNKLEFIIKSGIFTYPENTLVLKKNIPQGETRNVDVKISGGWFSSKVPNTKNEEDYVVSGYKASGDLTGKGAPNDINVYTVIKEVDTDELENKETGKVTVDNKTIDTTFGTKVTIDETLPPEEKTKISSIQVSNLNKAISETEKKKAMNDAVIGANNGDKVEVEVIMNVELAKSGKIESLEAKIREDINAAGETIKNNKIEYIDITIDKIVKANGNVIKIEEIKETDTHQIFSFPIASIFETSPDKEKVFVYRNHKIDENNEENVPFTKVEKDYGPSYNIGDGECYWLDGDYIYIKAKKFSVYGFGVQNSEIVAKKKPTPTPGPTPSSDPKPRYKIPNTGVDGTYSNNHSLLKLSSLSLLAIGTYMVIKKKKDN